MSVHRRLLVPVVLAAVAASCGGADPGQLEAPVAVAEEVPWGTADLEPPGAATPVEDVSDDDADGDADDDVEGDPVEASPTPEAPAAGGPTARDAAAFIAEDAPEGVTGLEHVVVDVDGDGAVDVVATGVRDRTGLLRIAWWRDGAYEVLAEDTAGPGTSVADLRVADVNDDGLVELLLLVEGAGVSSLSVWAVAGVGDLDRRPAVGGCHDGRHVYGVTRARLSSTGASATIAADCDESPLPVADWREHEWTWSNGAFRFVEPAPLPPPSPSPTPSASPSPSPSPEPLPSSDASAPGDVGNRGGRRP